MTYTGDDPRRLREMLDISETALCMLARYHRELVTLGKPQQGVLDITIAGISDLMSDLLADMDNMREAIADSPEGRAAAEAERPMQPEVR